MYWKRQGNKPNCGIIALSVITGKPIKKIAKIVGKNRTKTLDLHKALKKLGYNSPKRLKVFRKNKPELAIAKVSIPNTHNWHWVVIYKDKIYDGANGTKDGKVKWKKGWRMTSYLPVEKKDI